MDYIYRVQDKDGRGPWKPGFSAKWVRRNPDYSLKPWFVEWYGFNPHFEMQEGEHCGTGCIDITQLRKWFNKEEYATLRILGYKAVKIKPDRILRSSENQVLFVRKKALKKSVIPFELYE